jgi:hypothetical protein
MNLTDNPIFKRLVTISGRRRPHFMAIFVMSFVTLITFFFFLDSRRLLDSFLGNIPIVAAPIGIICVFILAGSGAVLTGQESRGEAFQLLRMTNISAYQVVWGYLGGIVFRTRLFIGVFIFALPLSIVGAFVEVRRDIPISVRQSIFYEPSVVEVILLYLVSALMSLCTVFLVLTSTVSQTLRTRQPMRAIATSMIANGLFYIGFNGFLTFAIMSETKDTFPMIIGVSLSLLPYVWAYLFSQFWATDPLKIAPLLNTIPFTIIIMAFFILGGITQVKTTLTFWAIFISVAVWLVWWIINHRDDPKVPTRVSILAWQAMIASVLMFGIRSGYEALQEVMLWIVMINLWLIPVAVGFQDLRRAMRYLWNERYYF